MENGLQWHAQQTLRTKCYKWRHDPLYDDIQHNDIQNNDTQHADTQHNTNEKWHLADTILSIMTLCITIKQATLSIFTLIKTALRNRVVLR